MRPASRSIPMEVVNEPIDTVTHARGWVMTRSRRGSLIGATWLIGLGVVFLVRQAMGWSWAEAWPLFVILVGVGAGASAVIGGARGLGILWAVTWPVAWVVVGPTGCPARAGRRWGPRRRRRRRRGSRTTARLGPGPAAVPHQEDDPETDQPGRPDQRSATRSRSEGKPGVCDRVDRLVSNNLPWGST